MHAQCPEIIALSRTLLVPGAGAYNIPTTTAKEAFR